MIKNEILASVQRKGPAAFSEALFHDFYIGEKEKEALLTGLLGGHHLLILGPPGCGKTAIANRIAASLDDIEVVQGCPLNCSPQNPSCPWCIEARRQGIQWKSEILPGAKRVKKVQGSSGLLPEDLIGDLNPEAAFTQGIHSLDAFVPGKLLRANRGILLIDFIDRIPERVLNTILYAMGGGTISIGPFEEKLTLDTLVIATGSERTLGRLPLDLIDHFDVVVLGYPDGVDAEKKLVANSLEQDQKGLSEASIDKVVDIVSRTRNYPEVERGVSTRGTIRYAELLPALREIRRNDEESQLREAAIISLPHRLNLSPDVDMVGKRNRVIEDILDEVLGEKEKEEELVLMSKEDIMSLVEEIAKEEKFKKPLKFGAFDLLLRRVRRSPDSKLAQVMKQVMQRMQELYPDRISGDNITQGLLVEIEDARLHEERKRKLIESLEEEALAETLSFLEQQKILERGGVGWELSRRGISFLLDKLAPKFWENIYVYGYGKHSTGKKLTLGEGKIIGSRQYRFGDRYRDVSFKETMREAIRNRRQQVTREDIMVNTKDIRARMDIVLVVDLSGTMLQLDKLWYAKESAIALSLAAAQYGDRVGVVTFSNLAEVVVDITANPYRLTKRMIDLELHENAFTNVGYGLLTAINLFAHHRRGRATQHIILISDGDANVPHPSPKKYALRQATRAAQKGITISCVCISEQSTDPELMRRIANIGRGKTSLVGAEGMTSAVLEERYSAASSV